MGAQSDRAEDIWVVVFSYFFHDISVQFRVGVSNADFPVRNPTCPISARIFTGLNIQMDTTDRVIHFIGEKKIHVGMRRKSNESIVD